MAAEPITTPNRVQTLRLAPFDARYAERVVSWVCGAREAYWLAPRTKPPLTADKVRAWASPGRNPLMLVAPGQSGPLAYGELNVLNEKRRDYWLGHLIVDPRQRGRGLGRRLTELLLLRAFRRHGARHVSLVVFPENEPAVACYRAAGMHDDGYETHYFASYRRRERLLRLAATRIPS
ncbi:MAG: GNAT family N-acetyltransferase [Phycisphaerae bacterium]